MAAARLAICRVAVRITRFPSIQTLRWSTSLSKQEEMVVSQTKIEKPKLDDGPVSTESKKELTSACGDVAENDEEMEQEEMFVDADACLGTDKREWGGPRRGGRFPEPTRYGDWERKGRCSDF